ncbi:MAG: NADP-specific glutamate dehydrogenase [Deltaproteobacteria bacterium]|nr:NADP-specific glutamate dehydrogenase [Deltaproteobacteria bacterium]
MSTHLDAFMERLVAKNPAQPEFHQAVKEVVESVETLIETTPAYRSANILERLVEPERVIMFRVPWVDDKGEVHVNRGYRIEMNSAIGPYKGGLRFHPSVDLGVLKFLAFEQVFKNSLTTLPMGGGKGGADFDPKGKSDHEIMRFCQSFMNELYRHIDPDIDVPAGDIGVGGREIGFLFGQYKRLTRKFDGALTGKGVEWGGSLLRPEATGFGVAYFVQEMLAMRDDSLEGKSVAVSGFGNVAWGAVQKVTQLGGKVVTLSGPDGYVHDPEGVTGEKIDYMKVMRLGIKDEVKPYADKFGATFVPGKRPWEVPVDIALPCAIQNELNGKDAKTLVDNGCFCVVEGANMPTEPEGVDVFQAAEILFAPGKAANAGGVGVSGLEMSQNAMHLSWGADEVDGRLHQIMSAIHSACVEHGRDRDYIDYVRGANIAGFIKIANAMIDQGVV